MHISNTAEVVIPNHQVGLFPFKTRFHFINGPSETGGFYEPLPIIGDNLVTSTKDFISDRFKLDPVYPNPVENIANLSFYLNSPGQIRLRLLDSQGRSLKVISSGNHKQGRYTIREDLSGLKPGTYFVQIEHGLFKESQKLIKIR